MNLPLGSSGRESAHPSRKEMRSRPTSAATSGFTLIELLVVIAIIAVLAALLIPALSRAKMSAKSAKCKSNLHQIGLALKLYVDDFEKYPLDLQQMETSDEVTGRNWRTWDITLLRYCGGTPGLFDCPGNPYHWDGGVTIFDFSDGRNYSYDYNAAGTASPAAWQRNVQASLGLGFFMSTEIPLPESKVRVPSDMVAIGENWAFGEAWIYREYSPYPAVIGPDFLPWFYRHGKLANAVFCDGHVESADPGLIPKGLSPGYSDRWTFKPDEARARRLNNDNEPHPETWPKY
jgi:prepilin-type N-terminal cleavage/methylation domain-containing protein/prepilin-type processing-associated H-X9-DG protein